MNYRHAYHAGNFADVFKHVALWALLAAMRRKDKPFFYLDSHAGGPVYRLDSEAARRTGEWRHGIGRLWHVTPADDVTAAYLGLVRGLAANAGAETPMVYPGSTSIAQAGLRDVDRAVFCDALPGAAHELKQTLGNDPRIAVHQRDGYEALKAFLPPAERRGVVLVDPPYESRNEFERLQQALVAAHRRWATGVFAAWYPLKDHDAVARFRRGVTDSGIRRVLIAELSPLPDDLDGRFHGAGMLLINPPWGVDEQLRVAGAGLLDQLADDRGRAHCRVEWLAGE